MPRGKVEVLNCSRWFGAFHGCLKKNVDCFKLLKLLFYEGIKAILFVLSACGLIQSLPRPQMSPRTRVGKHCPRKTFVKSPSVPPWKESFLQPWTKACKITPFFCKKFVVVHYLATLFNNTNTVSKP